MFTYWRHWQCQSDGHRADRSMVWPLVSFSCTAVLLALGYSVRDRFLLVLTQVVQFSFDPYFRSSPDWFTVQPAAAAFKKTGIVCQEVHDGRTILTASRHPAHNSELKLQTLVYDILPSTTAVFSYAKGSRKLSANEQFFVGAQTVVCLLQTIQIKQGVSFIAANKVYTSTNKTTIVWIEVELFSSSYPGWMRLMFTCVLWR